MAVIKCEITIYKVQSDFCLLANIFCLVLYEGVWIELWAGSLDNKFDFKQMLSLRIWPAFGEKWCKKIKKGELT